jgi:hypothetical protein
LDTSTANVLFAVAASAFRWKKSIPGLKLPVSGSVNVAVSAPEQARFALLTPPPMKISADFER